MEQKDVVTLEHADYQAAEPFRETFKDVCAGTAAMRAKGKAYLPQFPKERPEDWQFRKDMATLLNVTQKTVDTFCGLVFQKDMTLGDDVPPEIAGTETEAGLVENIDNKGNHLNVFARDLFEDSFAGCAGILVDAPTVKAADAEQQRSLGLRPYWVAYDACDITNWDYEINPISKRRELSLVVLRESITQKAGQFLRTMKTQYRVLMLDDSRNPVWQLWTERAGDDPKAKEFDLTGEGSFESQTRIPFAIVGELSDKPPLMDLAYKNIEHYQTYSDYKSVIHKTCVPMLWTAGLDGKAPDNIGGSSWWKLTEGGKMGFAEVAGGSIDKTRQSLEDIKADMALLGLAMMMSSKPKGDVTATEKLLDSIQETSALQVKATQLKDALELALGFTAAYLRKDEGGSIELGATWTELVISPQELTALSNLVDMGQMSLESFIAMRYAAGQLPEDVDVDAELERIDKEQKEIAKTAPVVDAVKMPNEQAPPNSAKDKTQPAATA